LTGRRLLEDFVVDCVAAHPISRADLEDLCVMNADPVVMTTLGGVRDRCSDQWGRGLAAAVCGQLAQMASRAGLAAELVAFTLPSNHRSRRVMEKAGFIYEREFGQRGAPHVLYRRYLTGAGRRAAYR
jgi:hypothetical protein